MFFLDLGQISGIYSQHFKSCFDRKYEGKISSNKVFVLVVTYHNVADKNDEISSNNTHKSLYCRTSFL